VSTPPEKPPPAAKPPSAAKPDNVVLLDCNTRLPLPPTRVIEGVVEFHEGNPLAEVVVCGFDEQGELQVFASEASKAKIAWLLERTKDYLLHKA